MKTCTKCNIEKENSSFARRDAWSLHAHCKACQRKESKRHYNKNWLKYKQRIQEKQRELRNWIYLFKTRPCMDCGGVFNPWQMDFDHRDSATKSMDVGRMAGKSMPRRKILAEIMKCDVVCANCHRNRTYKRQQHLNH